MDFSRDLWYNKHIENDALTTSTTEEMVTISCAEYEDLKARNAELEQKLNWLMEQLRLIHHRQFGPSSERISEDAMEQLSLLFNEAEVYADEEKSEPAPVAAHVRQKRSGSVRDRDVYHTYACADCEKNDVSTPVMKTPKEPPLIPGGFASPGFVAHIAMQKFVMGSLCTGRSRSTNG